MQTYTTFRHIVWVYRALTELTALVVSRLCWNNAQIYECFMSTIADICKFCVMMRWNQFWHLMWSWVHLFMGSFIVLGCPLLVTRIYSLRWILWNENLSAEDLRQRDLLPVPGRSGWACPVVPLSLPWPSHTAGSPSPSPPSLAEHRLQKYISQYSNVICDLMSICFG